MTDSNLNTVRQYEEILRAFDNSNELRQLCEDTSAETVMRILARFRETLEESAKNSAEALAAGEISRIWKACHKVAGSSELLGFKTFGLKSRQLSYALREQDSGAGSESMDSEELMRSFEAEIKQFLDDSARLSKKIDDACPGLKSFLS